MTDAEPGERGTTDEKGELPEGPMRRAIDGLVGLVEVIYRYAGVCGDGRVHV